MATTANTPIDNVIIVGEGFDELGERYIKLGIKGSDRELPPYSISALIENPKRLYRDLGNAGCKLLSPKLQRQLLEKIQSYQQSGKPTFKVVNRLGAYRKFYVRPDGIIGSPS